MTKDLVKIEGKSIERIEYRSQPVITFKMIDELHQRPSGTARQAFNRNKKYFIENEDFFNVSYKEWSHMTAVRLTYGGHTGQRNSIIFFTQSGYMMLVKPFRDELSWKIQRLLVRTYFFKEKDKEQKNKVPLKMLADQVADAVRLAKELGFGKREAALHANNAVKNATGYDCLKIMEAKHLFEDASYLTYENSSEPTPMQTVVCFVEDMCLIGSKYQTPKESLFYAYTRYCSQYNYTIQDDFEFLGLLLASIVGLQLQHDLKIKGIGLR